MVSFDTVNIPPPADLPSAPDDAGMFFYIRVTEFYLYTKVKVFTSNNITFYLNIKY